MVEASSLGLANSLTEEETALGLIYPRIERSKSFDGEKSPATLFSTLYYFVTVREITVHITKEVIRHAQKAVRFQSSPP